MQNELHNSEEHPLETTNLDVMREANKFNKNSRNLQSSFTDFCKTTKIYGFNYLADSTIFRIDKFYWLLFICIGFYFSISMIVHILVSWNRSPVILFTKNPKPIWEIPFPAVTICPETKIRQRVFNYTHNFHKMMSHVHGEQNMTSEELQTFSDASLFCDNHLHRNGNETTDIEKIDKFITEVSPSLQDVLFSCKLASRTQPCNSLFTPILTEEGLCFTFNMLSKNEIFSNLVKTQDNYMNNNKSSEEWTPENGYAKNAGKDTFPKRTLTSGTKGGFFLLLASYKDDIDYVCRGPANGFRVLLHHPMEIPKIGTQYIRVPLKQEVLVTVKPNLVTTSLSLQNVDPQERGCYFNNERHLKFFKNYDEENCRLECLANFTLASCGCVAFFMLRGEEDTRICGSGKTSCILKAEQELLIKNAESNLCNCLPSCTSLTYNVETSQMPFKVEEVVQAFQSDTNDYPGIQLTRLTIYLKNTRFDVVERNKLHSNTEFLATCGGLLALFCGFSFLSLAEIIYFACIRTTISIKKYTSNICSKL